MRITKLLLICMCCLIVSPAVWGQTANSSAKPGILGYLDPNTGAFRPVPAADETTDASRSRCSMLPQAARALMVRAPLQPPPGVGPQGHAR
jgi:hypothetical protein